MSKEEHQTLQQFGFPQRPGKGRFGKNIKVITNFFRLAVGAKTCYQYNVSILSMEMYEAVKKAREEQATDVPETNVRTPGAFVKIIQQLSRDPKRPWPSGWVYDGAKNIFSTANILETVNQGAWEDFQITVKDEEGNLGNTFIVILQYTQQVPVDQFQSYIRNPGSPVPRAAVQAIEVAFNNTAMFREDCVRIGRGIFYEPPADEIESIGSGLGMWLGYKQAVNVCETGLAINVDMAGAVFVQEMPVLQYVQEVMGSRYPVTELDPSFREFKDVRSALKDLRINLNHRYYDSPSGKRKYPSKIIDGSSPLAPPPEKAFFEFKGRKLSIAQYFREQYPNVDIGPSLQLPCLKLKGSGMIPMGCATIVTQQRRSNIMERAKSFIPRVMAKPPTDRMKRIKQQITSRILQDIRDKDIVPWNFKVATDPTKVDARILPAPALTYGSAQGAEQDVEVGTEGTWNLRNQQFFRAKRVDSWALVCFAEKRDVNHEHGLPRFLEQLCRSMRGMGMDVAGEPPVEYLPQYVRSIRDLKDNKQKMFELALEMGKAAKNQAENRFKQKCQILLCCMPSSNTSLYNAIKRATISSSGLGVQNQCFLADKSGIDKRARARISEDYCANLAMKVNAKLGGTTVVLAGKSEALPVLGLAKAPFMILGASVSHPGSSNLQSIASLVGTVDMFGQRYLATMRPQTHRMQMIENIGQMVRELVMKFYEQNKQRKPEKLVIFRGGVSEGEQSEVLEKEYVQIRKALSTLGTGEYAPPITFVVVNQNHSLRMFPEPGGDAVGKMRNVIPGTVIDSGVTHPHHFDFYIVSHQGIQGTSRPAHYTVLLDQNGFGPDGMQLLCYWLCYTFCRCTRAVSVVPAIYYATEVCKKAVAIQQRGDVSDSDSSVAGAAMEEVIQKFSQSILSEPGMFFV